MRKWLVGLLAAGLCAASAWATTDVLTAGDFEATSSTYKDFSGVTKDSGAVYAGNSGKTSDGAIQLRSNNSNSGIVTTESGGTASKVTLAWNAATVDDREVSVYGSTDAYTAATDLYAAASQGTLLGSLKKGDGTTELEIEGEYAYIGLRSKSGALYLDSVEIEWAGGTPPVFSVKLDPAEDFEVFQGKSASITATVKGAQGDVTYSWSVNGTPIDLAGNVYTVDSTELGEYEVSVEVSDGVADPLSASVKYTVVEAPVVTGDVLTRDTTGVTGSQYKDWTATGDSGTKYAGNSAGGNTSIQLNTGSPKGIVITESAGSDVASVTVEWNDATADKRSIEIYGSADAYAGPADLYGDAKGTLLGTLAKGETTLAVPEGYPYVGILAKGGALYLTSVAFEFAGEAGLSVTLDKANGFTVDLGTADSITATAKNGVEPYTYAWTSDTPDLNGTGETLAIPATLAEGDYTVQVEVTDAESNKASKQIGFSVVAPLEPHAINIDVGIQNGTVTSDPVGEAVKGTQVKLTATATTEGYALKEMTVTYGETVLTFTASPATFEMPDEAVSVGAIFAEVKDYAELPFVAEDTPYSGPWKTATVSGMTSKGLGNDYTSGGAVGARLDDTGDWLQIKFQGTAGELSYGIKGNSLSEEKPSTFKVQESADGETWADLATFTTGDNLTGSTVGYTNEVSASSQFVRFFYEEKGAGNVGIYDVYISSGGPATFSIKLDPASYFEVEVGEEASIAATPKNAEGEVHYAWTVGGEPSGSDSAVLGLDTTAATEEIEVVCTATDGADTVATASVSYKVVVPAPKFAVNVALGIQNGTVTTDVSEAAEGDLVTVTATPADGYRLVEIIVNNGEVAVTGNTFVMPAQDVLVTATFEEKPPVTGDVLTNDDVGSQTSSYKDWTAEKESGAVYAGQTAGGSATNPCIQLRTTQNNSGIVMTKDSGQNVSSVTIEWNAQSAAERVVQVYGSTTPYSSPADLYGDAKGTLLGELTNGSGEVTVDVAAVGEFPYIGIRSKSGAIYLTSVAIDFGGAAGPSVSLSASATEVAVGEPVTITATAKNFSAEVEWSWTGNGTADGATFAVDTTVAGVYEVTATATAGEETASKSVTITVVAKFAVNVALGIQNGTVTTDVSEAAEGDPVTVTATPADGYRLVEIIVNNGEVAVSGNTFVMPAQDVLVTATFEEFEVPPYYFQFETGKPAANSYKDTDADVVNTGSTSDTVPTVNFTLQRAGRGGDEKDKFVGTYALRMGPTNEVPAFFYNTEAFSEDITAISFQYGIYGTDKCESFTVSTSADGADWTQLADLTADASADGLKTYTNDELPAGVRFIRFDATSTQKSNIRRINIDEIQLWTGAPSPKIVYSGETTIALGDSFEIIFGLLNYEGDFEWVLDSREGGSIAPDGLYTWEPTEAIDEVTIKVVARSGELDIATKEVTLTVTEPGPQPGEPAIVFGGDTQGVVGQVVNFTVTAVNMVNTDIYGGWLEHESLFDAPEGSDLSDAGVSQNFPNVSFMPDVAGDYVFYFNASEGDEYCEAKWTVTVTDEPAPGGPFQITGVRATSDGLVLTFAGEGTPAVLGTASLVAEPQEWTPVEGATVSGNSATVPMGAQNYITLK